MSEAKALSLSLFLAARESGASDVEVLVDEVVRRVFQEGSAGRLRGRSQAETRVHLRVRDERGGVGVATAVDPSPHGFADLARSALGRAGLATPDPLGGPPERLDVPQRGLGICDLRVPTMEDADRMDALAQSVEGLGPQVEAVRFTYLEEQRTRVFHCSNGLNVHEASTLFSIDGLVRDRETGLESSQRLESRHFADVASVPLGVEIARRLLVQRTAVPAPPDCALLLGPGAVARLLPALMPAFSAEAMAEGRSFLAGKMGERIGSGRIHLIDDASLSGALKTRAFDDRGVAPLPVTLLREGVLTGCHVGAARARAMGGRPTGHERADGGFDWGNLILRAGSRTRNMLLPELGEHLAIEEILGVEGVDLATGQLDLPVRVLVMSGPQVVGTAGEGRLRVGVVELLSAVVELCSDQERIRETDACTWILRGIRPELG